MGRQKVGWLTNGLGPLERETYDDLKGWRWLGFYSRLRSLPLGKTEFGGREVRWVFGTKVWEPDVMDVYLTILDNEEEAIYYDGATTAGRFTKLNLTIRDIDQIPHGEQVDPSARPVGAGLWPLLKTFALRHRETQRLEFLRTPKEIGQAKTVLLKCGGDAQLAVRLVNAFFNMSPDTGKPDDMNFTVFTWYVDKLMAAEATERQWEEARDEGALAAEARKRIPTAADDAKFKAEMARYREETRQRKERETQQREDNAL